MRVPAKSLVPGDRIVRRCDGAEIVLEVADVLYGPDRIQVIFHGNPDSLFDRQIMLGPDVLVGLA